MTRRELPRATEDVESQSIAHDPSTGFPERSSNLPTYEDAVGDTPASASVDSKGNYDMMVSERSNCQAIGSTPHCCSLRVIPPFLMQSSI
jgi:hypothetical protein